ncbi:DUF177 domain-containing protein [Lutimaribacter sp. EGI FJ00015]|uniref:DUF177 domain-containing protein n=1 Tax=Lutimaribacter degradans TaxID=2945989 RepID=A0ACC5ZWV8_9RHOB|nr:DUF177 domain-containing protein [Lutimaribacter sp. EGI FJ00013]MCM2562428.1 DUF177 domain-containing protein [Lutimaribacter sp. EGI FJ00013]MCO0613585.1 DUF177 domain-containing protein [Lutimaribacter sp. EGI FJ00015]MCO0636557.1 DUF177 domain-containing protein [Lutimaribacter sp. EGI FJ00014]
MTHRPNRHRVADLPPNRPLPFELRPTPEANAALAAELGLSGLRKLSFKGELRPDGAHDWRLDGHLGATVTQPCVVTLAPVTTRLEEPVTRRFLSRMPESGEEEEVEMPEDDSIEPLGDVIDLDTVMAESLALALPLYPRAEDAELGETVVTEPGKAPIRDEDTKPFAGLADLRDALKKDE